MQAEGGGRMQSLVQNVYHSAEKLSKHSHFHDCHQIIFVVKGKAVFCVNGKTLHATAGDIAIFSRYENHSVAECSDEYERYVLLLDPDVANQKSTVYSLLTDRPAVFCNIIHIAERMDQIVDLFKHILFEHHNP